MQTRKTEHLTICTEKEVESGNPGFNAIRLEHNALPEVNFDDISLKSSLIGKTIKAPIIIEAITGGTKISKQINADIAEVAEELGIPVGVGSERIAVKNPSAGDSFRIVAKKAPTVPKIANLGAIQLNNGFGVEQCIEAMELIKTDIIAFHLNPLQELIQKEGNKNFSGLHKKLSIVCKELHKLGKKVIIKETGNGISLNVAKKLVQLVDCIDIGGLGGTSWAIVEGLRSKNKCAEAFKNWGIPTAEALIELKELKTEIIASGGVRSGIDVAKSIAVGATAAGIALPVLKAWHSNGKTGVKSYLKQIIEELRITMFLTGAKDIEALKKLPYKLIRNGDTSTWRI